MYRYTLTCNNDATSEVLDRSPIGWDEKGYSFQENEVYHGVLSEFTIQKLGFTRDKKTKKGGLNFILSKYEVYGVEADLEILIEYVNTATNAYVTWANCRLSWLDSPEQQYNMDDDAMYMKLTDTSDRERFRENDELVVDVLSDEDLEGNSITTENAVSCIITGQDLFKEYKGGVDTDTGLQTDITTVNDDVFSDASQTNTNNIGDVIVLDGSQKKIYTNSIGDSTEVQFNLYDSTRNLYFNIINSSPGSTAQWSAVYNFYIQHFNSGGTPISSLIQIDTYTTGVLSFTTASQVYNFADTFTYDNTFTMSDGDYIELYAHILITPGANVDAANSQYEITNQFTLDIFEKSYTPVDTNSYLILAHEAVENILQVITGNTSPLYSPILGRTDLGYSEDGFLGLVGIGMGWQFRQFPLAFKSISLSFKELFQSLNAIHPIYLSYDNDNSRFVLDSIENRYLYTPSVYTIHKPAKFKRIFSSNLYFNSIKAGQKNKVEYEIFNGVEEAMTPYDFGTSLPFKGTYDAASQYNLDPTGIEVLRRKRYFLTASEDTKNDDNVYLVRLERYSGSYRTKALQSGEETINILNGSTRLNLEFTSKRNLIRHGAIMASIYHKNVSGMFKYLNSQLKSDMGTKLTGESTFLYENTDINVADLDTRYFKPELVEFEYPISDSLLTTIKANPHGIYAVETDIGVFLGFISKDGVRTNAYDRTGNWSLLVRIFAEYPAPDGALIDADGNFIFDIDGNYIVTS